MLCSFVISGYNKESVRRILSKIVSKPRGKIVPWVVTHGPGAKKTRDFVQLGTKIMNKSEVWKELGQKLGSVRIGRPFIVCSAG